MQIGGFRPIVYAHSQNELSSVAVHDASAICSVVVVVFAPSICVPCLRYAIQQARSSKHRLWDLLCHVKSRTLNRNSFDCSYQYCSDATDC